MKLSRIEAAVAEAERFLDAAEACIPVHAAYQAHLEELFGEPVAPHMRGSLPSSPQTATLRRASMDLTRALARLRGSE